MGCLLEAVSLAPPDTSCRANEISQDLAEHDFNCQEVTASEIEVNLVDKVHHADTVHRLAAATTREGLKRAATCKDSAQSVRTLSYIFSVMKCQFVAVRLIDTRDRSCWNPLAICIICSLVCGISLRICTLTSEDRAESKP
eukprot:5010066-Pleurochrysis_carterae.AAC.1